MLVRMQNVTGKPLTVEVILGGTSTASIPKIGNFLIVQSRTAIVSAAKVCQGRTRSTIIFVTNTRFQSPSGNEVSRVTVCLKASTIRVFAESLPLHDVFGGCRLEHT